MAAPTDLSDLSLYVHHASGVYNATSGGSTLTTTGELIKRWEDASGLGNHLTQATDANCLIWDADNSLVVGGITRNVDGNQSWMDFPASFTVDRQDFTLAVVAEFSTCWGNGGYTFFTASTSNQLNLHLQDTTGRLAAFDGGFKTGGASAVPTITRCLVVFVGRAGSFDVWVNGDKTTTTALSSGSATLTRLFGFGAGGLSLSAAVRSAVVYSAAKSDSEITNTLLAWAVSDHAVRTSFATSAFFLGDSISHAYGTVANRGWVQRAGLSEQIRLYGCNYSGATAAGLASAYATLVSPLVQADDVVVAWAGTNDIATGGTGASAYSSLTSLVTSVQGDDAKAVLVTPLPRGAGAIAGEYAVLRTAVNGNAAAADAVIDPTGDATLAAAWGDGTYDYDDVHPNDTGYQYIGATLLAPTIASLAAVISTSETTLERGQSGQTLHVTIVGATSTSTSDWTLAVGMSSGSITAIDATDPAAPILTVTAPQTAGTATLTFTPTGSTCTLDVTDTTAPNSPSGVSAGSPTVFSVPVSFTLPAASPAGETITGRAYRNDVLVASGLTSSPYTFSDVEDGDVLGITAYDGVNESAATEVTFAAPSGGSTSGASRGRIVNAGGV